MCVLSKGVCPRFGGAWIWLGLAIRGSRTQLIVPVSGPTRAGFKSCVSDVYELLVKVWASVLCDVAGRWQFLHAGAWTRQHAYGKTLTPCQQLHWEPQTTDQPPQTTSEQIRETVGGVLLVVVCCWLFALFADTRWRRLPDTAVSRHILLRGDTHATPMAHPPHQTKRT